MNRICVEILAYYIDKEDKKGSDGGQAVSVLTFHCDDCVRILLKRLVFVVQFGFENNKDKQKRGRSWPIFK